MKKTVNRSLKNLRSWQKGQSGNPGGRPKQKPILDALESAILADPKLLKDIAKKALKPAAAELEWFTEVRNMLDGKPEGGKPDGTPEDPVNFGLTVRFVDCE